MDKQSSIEWLVTELNQMIDYIPLSKWDKIADIIKQAKQMHQEEIETAYFNGGADQQEGKYKFRRIYYQETYGGNNE